MESKNHEIILTNHHNYYNEMKSKVEFEYCNLLYNYYYNNYYNYDLVLMGIFDYYLYNVNYLYDIIIFLLIFFN